MPNRSADPLFQLICSLHKAEKRNFKLYINRSSGKEDLKIVQLFDAIDKLKEYDETVLLKKLPSIKKQQLSNLKAHLYKQVLASLRLLRNDDSIDIQLHEQLDYARILYNKGLYHQSLKLLDKVKEMAYYFNQDSILIQVISLEKKIETLHITRSMEDRADRLSAEAVEVNERRQMITRLSNLALQLYSWYIRHGHARNEKDEEEIKQFFAEHMPADASHQPGFYQRLYFYQCYGWYAFIRQDFLMYYRYTSKWVSLFHEYRQMIPIETAHYIKGLHNLLNAHFDLRNDLGFEKTLAELEALSESPEGLQNDNYRIQIFVYLHTARINSHFMKGSFKQGLLLVPQIEEKLLEYALYLDRHRVLIFYYKIASLYFGSGDYNKAIDYLQKIIHWNVDLRNDLQSYARLLHLLAHYELGNDEIIEHLVKSVYRFMSKTENMTIVEEEMFKFLRNNFYRSARSLTPEFEKLLAKMKTLESNRFETRAFAYLDIISWLESKVTNKSMAVIISDKYKARNKKRLRSTSSGSQLQPS